MKQPNTLTTEISLHDLMEKSLNEINQNMEMLKMQRKLKPKAPEAEKRYFLDKGADTLLFLFYLRGALEYNNTDNKYTHWSNAIETHYQELASLFLIFMIKMPYGVSNSAINETSELQKKDFIKFLLEKVEEGRQGSTIMSKEKILHKIGLWGVLEYNNTDDEYTHWSNAIETHYQELASLFLIFMIKMPYGVSNSAINEISVLQERDFIKFLLKKVEEGRQESTKEKILGVIIFSPIWLIAFLVILMY